MSFPLLNPRTIELSVFVLRTEAKAGTKCEFFLLCFGHMARRPLTAAEVATTV